MKTNITTNIRYFQKNVRINQLKKNHNFFSLHNVEIEFYVAKNPITIWDVHVDNIVISKLVTTKTNYKYLIGYLDQAIRLLVLIMPKTNGYVNTFKVKDRDKDKNNKLIYFRIDDKRLLEKYKAILTKIEDLKTLNEMLYQSTTIDIQKPK